MKSVRQGRDLDDKALASLIEFGFDQEKSLLAVQVTNGDIEAAAQLVSSSSVQDLEALLKANIRIHNKDEQKKKEEQDEESTTEKGKEEVKKEEKGEEKQKEQGNDDNSGKKADSAKEQKQRKEEDENYMKMTIAVRRDLKMSKGKVAAQVAHAVLGLYKKASLSIPAKVLAWELNSWPKIVLQVEDQQEMELIITKAVSIGVQYCAVHDAGKTEVPSGTLTCCAFGPDGAGRVNQVTGDLRLLK